MATELLKDFIGKMVTIFAEGELGGFQGTILAVENNNFDIKVDEDAVRICPACGAKMVKNSTSAKGEITIDECYTCGAKFLDHGELTKIRAEYATEQERADAAVRALLYSPEGAQLGLAKTSNRVNRVSILGNFFTKFMH
jgi:Zn-finger nucleic acid-binding protein